MRAAASAKAMRRAMTEPEKRLWWHLRHRMPLEGTHFRRQVAIGPYIADFCLFPERLIVEVDGEQHGFPAAAAHDARRTKDLQQRGFRVLRFANREVMREIDSVLDMIRAELVSTTPTPSPSPQGGGERAPAPQT